ncbi:hypothetical protein EYV94_04865 [Puteibacter caeruleilacunae]|nr:hypothetical protein EYV94_04865 [Puteibacter caeruleilacunae]
MKKILGILMILGACLGFYSCEDEDEVIIAYYPIIVQNTVTHAIAYETIGLDFLTMQASIIVNESIENPQPSYSESEHINNSWVNGWNNYDYEMTAIVNGEGIDFTSSASGAYETYLMKSDDEIINNWELIEIVENSDYYRLSGESTRTGSQYSKAYDDSFESTVTFTFNNVEVNRITGFIKQGTVKFTYQGVSSYGAEYTSSGEVVYSDYKNVVRLN